MAFDRGHIGLSYDPNGLNISIEIKIFWADGPFKQQSPRMYFSDALMGPTHTHQDNMLVTACHVLHPARLCEAQGYTACGLFRCETV